MDRILVSLPDELSSKFKAIVPPRQRSKVIRDLLRSEVKKYEQRLYQAACEVEQDEQLNKEMQEWDITLTDGLED